MFRNVFLVVAVLAVAAGAAVWWAVQTRPEEAGVGPSTGPAVPVPPVPERRAELQAKGVDLEEKDAAGNLLWKLRADGTFTADREKGTARGEQVKWELVTKDGPHWLAEAPETEIDQKAGRLVFIRGVHVRTADGALAFDAPKVTYEKANEKLLADGPVTITVKAGKLTVGELVVDTKTKELRAKRVRGTYRF